MVLVLAAVILAALLVVALVATVRAARRDEERPRSSTKLPAGADAALWSIVEAVPDPRNHLALTRDLTGEVRIAGTVLDPEVRAAARTRRPAPVRDHLAPTGGLDLWDTDETPAVRIANERIDLTGLDRAS